MKCLTTTCSQQSSSKIYKNLLLVTRLFAIVDSVTFLYEYVSFGDAAIGITHGSLQYVAACLLDHSIKHLYIVRIVRYHSNVRKS